MSSSSTLIVPAVLLGYRFLAEGIPQEQGQPREAEPVLTQPTYADEAGDVNAEGSQERAQECGDAGPDVVVYDESNGREEDAGTLPSSSCPLIRAETSTAHFTTISGEVVNGSLPRHTRASAADLLSTDLDAYIQHLPDCWPSGADGSSPDQAQSSSGLAHGVHQKTTFLEEEEIRDLEGEPTSTKRVRFASECKVRHVNCDSELEDGMNERDSIPTIHDDSLIDIDFRQGRRNSSRR